MTTNRRGGVLRTLSWLLVAAGLGAFISRESPIAVILDVESLGFSAAGLAMFSSALAIRANTKTGGPVFALALVTVGLFGWSHFLVIQGEEIQFASVDVQLSGTLYTPRSAGPHPAVVLIHGPGPATRRESSFYARFLARRGIAGLAYDKRGAGKSSGETHGVDYHGYASDARAAVEALRSRPDIDPHRIGLFGHSEGEWVASIAAASDPAISLVVVTGASGLSPAEQVAAEMRIRLEGLGYPDSIVQQALALNEQVFHYQRTGEGREALSSALRDSAGEPWFVDAGKIPLDAYPYEEYSWWRSVMDFDAAAAWRQVRQPVLLIKGERDPKSPAELMRRNIEQALRNGGNHQFQTTTFPGADHNLLVWPLGDGIPPPAFADGYLDTLSQWIQDQVSRGTERRIDSNAASASRRALGWSTMGDG